jgi:hypothetical protein
MVRLFSNGFGMLAEIGVWLTVVSPLDVFNDYSLGAPKV